MVKFSSYYDWELRLKKKVDSQNHKKLIKHAKRNNDNELGINEKLWKEFLKLWKEKNLP